MSGGRVLTHPDRRFDIQWLYVKDIPNVEIRHTREKYVLTAHHQVTVNQRKQEQCEQVRHGLARHTRTFSQSTAPNLQS